MRESSRLNCRSVAGPSASSSFTTARIVGVPEFQSCGVEATEATEAWSSEFYLSPRPFALPMARFPEAEETRPDQDDLHVLPSASLVLKCISRNTS